MRKFNYKWFIVIILIVIIVAGAVTATVLLLSPKDDGMKIRSLGGDITQNRPADYSDSRLRLFDNGTFTVEIIYMTSNEFVGIGTYKKSGSKYIFTYSDMWRRIGTEYQRDTNTLENGNGVNYLANGDGTVTVEYGISKKQIEIKCPNNRLYYFK